MFAMARATAKRQPLVIALAKANTEADDTPANWEEYKLMARAPANGRANSGIEVYLQREQISRIHQLWESGEGDALLIQVLTPKGNGYMYFGHAPHVGKVGVLGYREF